MEAKDLTIGDWVCARKDRNLPFKITEFVRDRKHNTYIIEGQTPSGCYVYHFCIEEIKPIHLTPEILEKNGWKLDEKFSGDDPCLVLDLSDEDPNWMRNLYWYNDVLYLGDFYYCDCFFVHHLQHALRLLGKDNHADTFKLN